MQLTKRQEKQLIKSFNDPKKLRKWVDEVYDEMIRRCEEMTKEKINEYMDIYSIMVAYTLRYACGFGKKRLPEIMKRIWENVDSTKDDYLSLEDCIEELYENGIDFTHILHKTSKKGIKNDK
jgi:hypothetical protein